MSNRDNSDDKLDAFRPRIGRTGSRDANGSPRAPFASRRSCAEVTGASAAGRRRGSRPPPASVLDRTPAASSSKRTCRSSEVTAPRRPRGTCGTSSATASRRTARRACSTAPRAAVARETFEQPRLGERHQFRFIVSPEDARDLDLTDYVRELMKRVETRPRALHRVGGGQPPRHRAPACARRRPRRLPRGPATADGSRLHRPGPSLERPGARDRALGAAPRERDSADARAGGRPGALHLARPRDRAAATERRVDAESFVQNGAMGPEPALLVRRLKQLESLGLAEKVAPSALGAGRGLATALARARRAGRHPQADAPCATRRRRGALPRGAARPGASRRPGRRRRAEPRRDASSAKAWATSSTGGRSTP